MLEAWFVAEAETVFWEEPLENDSLIRLCTPLAEPSRGQPGGCADRSGDRMEKA
jgi:hypothetical protein